MSDDGDKKDNIGSLIKSLQNMKYPVFPDFISNLKNTSQYKLAEELKNSKHLLSIQTLGLASNDPANAKKFKALAEYGRVNATIKLPYDPAELAARFGSLANHEAIQRTINSFADVGKSLTDYVKMYSFLAPPNSEMAWLDSYVNSALFKYLSSNLGGSFKPENFVELEGAATISVNAKAEAEVFAVEVAPNLEAEIVDNLERGAGLSGLSDSAKQYLVKYWPHIKFLMEFFAVVMFCQQFYETQINEAKTPTELRAVVRSIPAEYRELMEGERVVVRDSVILRSGPSKTTEELARMKIGTRLEFRAQRGSWIHVSVNLDGEDFEGWVYAPYTLKL